MSEQSLRDALEELAADWRSLPHDQDSIATTALRHCGAQLVSLLAAHPAEPAPVVTDEAVKKVREWLDEYYDFALRGTDEAARLLLEAAAPLLGARPLLNEDAVGAAITKAVAEYRGYLVFDGLGSVAAGAVLELTRPMPTREQIAEAMHNHQMETHRWRQGCRQDACIDIFLDRADAVLALLNGSES